MNRSILFALLVTTSACSSRDSPPATHEFSFSMPWQGIPGPYGTKTLEGDGGATIFVDTIGGYQLELPGAATIERSDLKLRDVPQQGIRASLAPAGTSLLYSVDLFRFDGSHVDAGSSFPERNRYGLRRIATVQLDEAITVAGLRGRHLRATTENASPEWLEEWALYDPAHRAAYLIMVEGTPSSSPDRKAAARFIATFRRADGAQLEVSATP